MTAVMESHLDFIERQKGNVTSTFYGYPIQSTDGVYHPIEGSSTYFLGDALFGLIQADTSLLEIGCGSGAISCVAAKLGVSRVVATDINRQACLCAMNNVKELGLEKQIQVVQSDLLDTVSQTQFDFVIFNAPLLHCQPLQMEKDEYNEIAIDHNGATLIRFIENVPPFLNRNGVLLITISNIGDREILTKVTDMLGELGDVTVASALYKKFGNQWRFVLSVETS